MEPVMTHHPDAPSGQPYSPPPWDPNRLPPPGSVIWEDASTMSTANIGYPPGGGDGGGGKPKRKKRVFMWVFLVVQALFLIWLISSLTGQKDAVDATCTGLTGTDLTDCQDAAGAGAAVGSGIAFFLVLFLWTMVDVILGVIYMVTRRRA
jgi:hypothetical protein